MWHTAFSWCPELTAQHKEQALERFLRLTLQPIGNLIADELTRKLETPVSLEFPAIGSGDIAARARGFKSLVDGGMNVEKALALSGLLMAEEN